MDVVMMPSPAESCSTLYLHCIIIRQLRNENATILLQKNESMRPFTRGFQDVSGQSDADRKVFCILNYHLFPSQHCHNTHHPHITYSSSFDIEKREEGGITRDPPHNEKGSTKYL